VFQQNTEVLCEGNLLSNIAPIIFAVSEFVFVAVSKIQGCIYENSYSFVIFGALSDDLSRRKKTVSPLFIYSP